MAAETLGKEAALFVPSGTMGNLVSLAALARGSGLGSEVLVGDESHIYHYEQGGMSTLLGLSQHVVRTAPDGTLPLEEVAKACRPDDAHYARSTAVAVENTHNRCGGRVLPLEYMQDLRDLADERSLSVHVDGARLFNAAEALSVPVWKLASCADTVTVCLSKGLGAPVGSVVAGSASLIAQAHRTRKMLGGGMRQAGSLAGAGLFALRENVSGLARDHKNARMMAKLLGACKFIHVDAAAVESNIVYFDVPGLDAEAVVSAAKAEGVLLSSYGTSRLRLVTHLQVSDTQAERVVDVLVKAVEDVAQQLQ